MYKRGFSNYYRFTQRILEHQKFQDLVYVKYNHNFVDHFNSHDVIDLIVLNDIDERKG